MDTAPARFAEDQVKAGKSGLQLIADNYDAFAVRALAARSAVLSLDLMYYLWRDDNTGRLLLREVVRAADRGVKVRLLLDDINPRSTDATYLALDGHPNIQLRLFNATGMRNSRVLRALELVARMFAMTRRMHNKAWIVDGKVAIVGGRNIGDAYFDAAETNFRDLDLLLLGPAAEQTSAIFERFWTCSVADPIRRLNNAKARKLAPLLAPIDGEASSRMLETIKHESLDAYIAATSSMHWTHEARVISDPPEKVAGNRRRNWLMHELLPVIEAARHHVEVVSPYFIPGRRGTKAFRRLIARKVKISVLTNSLAATDVAAVHGGYANYRRRLLRLGVELFELQRFRPKEQISVFGSKGASLHTKAFSVDDRVGFVGSFNFDPRSVSLNSEMGVLFEDRALVTKLRERFESEKSPETSFRVVLRGGRLHWIGNDENDRLQDYVHEPGAGILRRLIATVVRFLPLESQL